MKIDVYPVYTQVSERELRERVIIMMDVLCTGGAILATVNNGAAKIIPLSEVDDAIALSRTLDRRDSLIVGERDFLPLPGCDCGASPLQLTADRVAGKTVVMTTSDGTAALTAARITDRVLVGSLLNRTALARAIVHSGQNAVILCAGTNGRFSAEDIYGAGGVVSAVRRMTDNVTLNDVGILSELFYEADRQDHSRLMQTANIRRMLELGLSADVDYCFAEDALPLVPVYFDGVVSAAGL